MPSQRILKSVAHNIAHHAQSSLSWLHPHLGQACRVAGISTVELELLDAQPYPAGLPRVRPLELALRELQKKFWEILESQGLARTTVRSVRLAFSFSPMSSDDYTCAVDSAVSSTNGRVYWGRVA